MNELVNESFLHNYDYCYRSWLVTSMYFMYVRTRSFNQKYELVLLQEEVRHVKGSVFPPKSQAIHNCLPLWRNHIWFERRSCRLGCAGFAKNNNLLGPKMVCLKARAVRSANGTGF